MKTSPPSSVTFNLRHKPTVFPPRFIALLYLLLLVQNVAEAANLFNQPLAHKRQQQLLIANKSQQRQLPITTTKTTTTTSTLASSTDNSTNSTTTDDSHFFVDLEVNLLEDLKLLEQLFHKRNKSENITNTETKSSGKKPVAILDNDEDDVATTNIIFTTIFSTDNNSSSVYSNISHLISKFRLAEFFSTYRFHFIVVCAVLLSVIAIILSVMIVQFVSRRRGGGLAKSDETKLNEKINKKMMLKYKKKNASFDIIDSGYYKPARRSSSSFKLFNNNNGSSQQFNRSNSTTETQLVVDYDYQFENFVTNPAALHQHLSASRNFDKIVMGDHFYELPSINNYSSLMAAAAAAGGGGVGRRVSCGGIMGMDTADMMLDDDDGQRFKTFSVRKFEKEKQKFNKSVVENNVNCGVGGVGVVAGAVKKFHSFNNPVGGGNGSGNARVLHENEMRLKLHQQQHHHHQQSDLRNNMITEIYEPSISICFDKISLSDLSSVDKQSF